MRIQRQQRESAVACWERPQQQFCVYIAMSKQIINGDGFGVNIYLSGECQVLCQDQVRLLTRRRLDSSVAISIHWSTSVFMTS